MLQTATRTKRGEKMKKVLLFMWNILKQVILFPFYCSLPDKYSGVSYEEWLGEKKEKDEPEDESKYY